MAGSAPRILLPVASRDRISDRCNPGAGRLRPRGRGHRHPPSWFRQWPGLRADPLIAERFVPVCTHQLLRAGKPLTKPDYLAHATLLYDMDWPDAWPRWFEAAGLRLSRRQRRLSFSNSDLMLQA